MTIRGLANKGLTIKGAAAAATTSTNVKERTATSATNRSSPMQQQSRTGGILDRISSPKQQQQQQQQQQQEHKTILNRISSPSPSSSTNKSTGIMSHLSTGRQAGGIKNRLSSPSSSPSMDNNNNNRSSPLNRVGRQRGKEQESAAPSPATAGQAAVSVSTTGKSSTLLIKNLSDSTTESDIRQFGQAIPGGITHIALEKQQAKVTLKDPQSAVLFRRKYNR